MSRRDAVVVGSGHNGLVAACYLARAGLDVEVVERDQVAGGAVSTVQRWQTADGPARADRGSSLHILIRHTGIVEDLRLDAAGLRYVDADPWAVAWSAPGSPPIRFATSVADTCSSIESVAGTADADAYERFVADWTPRADAVLALLQRPPTAAAFGRAFWPLGRRQGRSGDALARAFLAPADAILAETFADDRVRAPLSWWAAQAGPPGHEPATAPLLAIATLMHRLPPGRPFGGSGALTDALRTRLASYGGTLRLGDAVTSLTGSAAGVTGVRTRSGDGIEAPIVVAACHALDTLRLLGDNPETVAAQRQLRIGAGMGIAVRLLTDALPAWPSTAPGAAGSMQMLVRSTAQLRASYGDFLRGEAPNDPPLLVLTPTADDPGFAPAGRHVVTVWTQWHPRELAGGRDWDEIRDQVGDAVVAQLDSWAPGFAGSVLDRFVQTPADLERELGLHAGNVMHLEMSLDAMFRARPLPGVANHRGWWRGLYLAGASTHPGGGVAGISGRNAAQAVLADRQRVARRWARR